MLLDVQNLSVKFASGDAQNVAVNDVSFSIEEGKTFCIVGESGSGKSVTSLSVMGLTPPAAKISGKILFEGEDLCRYSNRKMMSIRGKKIATIFQEPLTSLNPSFTIGYQIEESLRLHQPFLSAKERKKKTIESLESVGIPDPALRYGEYPFKLSGGQRQRVMIAMAMVCRPKLLIADEPTTALDVTIQAQVLDLMKALQKNSGTAILFITHDLGVVYNIADEVAVMYKGQIVERQAAAGIFKDPKHPYTRALLASIPHGHGAGHKTRLATIDDNINYLDLA